MTAPDTKTVAGGGPPMPPAQEPQSGQPRRGHRLGQASVAIPARALAGLVGGGEQPGQADGALPPPVTGERRDLSLPSGRIVTYATGPETALPPLVLIHSINAAASAYEVKPIFDHYAGLRRVYALDLPGYGLSDRPERLYSPRLMTDTILAMVEDIGGRHGGGPVDAVALSLSSEFLARAATERPDVFRSIGLVSPTGFDSRGPRKGPPGSDRGMPGLYKAFTFGLWRRPFFDLLTSRVSIRYFLEKTWGSKRIDEGLFAYDVRTTRQPGAEHAPYSFISGFLFSNDISRVYESLTLPVWMVHGVRGDFVDYRGKTLIENRPNWTVDVLDTGALPQFETIDRFVACYDAFLGGLPLPIQPAA